jgi:hypothetical protein
MKNLIILLSLSLILITASCSGGSGDIDNSNSCSSQFDYVAEAFERCNSSEDIIATFREYQQNNGCDIYDPNTTLNNDKPRTCHDGLRALSCEDVNKIKTVDDIDSSLGCFDFPKRTNKEVCEENLTFYCIIDVYKACGYDKLPEYCHVTGKVEDQEGQVTPVLNKEKIIEYCATTIDGDNDMEDKFDLFHRIDECRNYEFDCENIPEVDFRNDDWKTQCVEQ